MDLSNLSDEDVQHLASGDMTKVSDEGLQHLAAPQEKTSALEAGLTGAANSALLGYYPEAKAGLQTIGNMATQGQLGASNIPTYASLRDKAREDIESAKQEHPYAYYGGAIGGGLATAPLLGGALKAIPLLGAAGEVKTIGQGAMQGLKVGGLIGAAENPNSKPGEEGAQIGKRVGNSLGGMAAGSILGAGGGLISKIGNPEELATNAEMQALKAFKPDKRDLKMNASRLQELGRTALDEGIIAKQPKSYEELAEASAVAAEKKGAEIGKMISDMAQAAQSKGTKLGLMGNEVAGAGASQVKPSVGIDSLRLAQSAMDDFTHLKKLPDTQGTLNKVSRILDDFSAQNSGVIPIDEAQKLKVIFGKEINWKRLPDADIPLREQVYRSLYSKLRQGIEDTAEGLADELGPQAKEEYIKAKQDYGNLQELARIGAKSNLGELANRYISMSDYQSGQLGGALGMAMHAATGPHRALHTAMGAAAGALGNKAARTFGNQPMAYYGDKAAQAVENMPVLQALSNQLQKKPVGLLNTPVQYSNDKSRGFLGGQK